MDDDGTVRVLRADEMRRALDLFLLSIHQPPVDDAAWAAGPVDDHAGRTFGAFDGGELVGTTWSFASRTTVPGGAGLPTAAVTRVGVRPDRTRRGHLTSLIRAQLADVAARGEVLATLTASETAIYGRFGFGVGTRAEHVHVRTRTGLRPAVPGGGTVRMPEPDRVVGELAALQQRIGLGRPGAMTRTPEWWSRVWSRTRLEGKLRNAVVHTGPDGDDGYAVWMVDHAADGLTLTVLDLQAAGPAATAGLWRFLLGVDLAEAVAARYRPRDEDLDLVLADPREVRVENRLDELWVRLVDVPAALAARSWGDGAPVVLRVHDHLLPANDATFRIGPEGPKPVEDGRAPDLECDVAALAMAYLGDRRPSDLVAAGWWRAHEDTAAARADALFATGVLPWCGTFF